MFSFSRKLISAVAAASLLGVFSTTVVPQISADSGQAQAAAKKKKKKAVVRSRVS
jgi:hypothetical protein